MRSGEVDGETERSLVLPEVRQGLEEGGKPAARENQAGEVTSHLVVIVGR